MRTNERARKAVADDLLPGEAVQAVVGLAYTLGTASAGSSTGASVYGIPYATSRGIDFEDPTLRADLVMSWCTVTDGRLVFHAPSRTSIRPRPGRLVEAMPRAGIGLAWFDTDGFGMSNRVLHLTFPDGRHLLSATMLKATLRRKAFNDEPELLVSAFGDRARQVADA